MIHLALALSFISMFDGYLPARYQTAQLQTTQYQTTQYQTSPIASQQANFAAVAQPVASCPASMTFDSASGRCKTWRTTTSSRSYTCPSTWQRGAGIYGSSICRKAFSTRVQVGSRRVFTHNTTTRVWVSTGSRRVLVRNDRKWIPPRTTVTPIIPPIRVTSGYRRERRCSYAPYVGAECWYINVPIYRWISRTTSTTRGRYVNVPVYENVPTGYWKTTRTPHYASVPIYGTRTTWRSQPARLSSCFTGWTTKGSQCERTTLGEPSANPQLRCPSGMRLTTVGWGSNRLNQCAPTEPEKPEPEPAEPDTAADPGADPAEADTAADTGANPADNNGDNAADNADTADDNAPGDTISAGSELGSRLASLSDSQLSDIGIVRCANGLLSYVSCDSLPEREWEQDKDVCDGVPGTVYTSSYGGSCRTGSDSLTKCTNPNSCNQVSVRTYCPAISQLSTSTIRQQASARGQESYRVCVFTCDRFTTMPAYVRERILQSPDYACAPGKTDITTTTSTTSTTTTTTTPTTTTPTTTTVPRTPRTTVPRTTVPRGVTPPTRRTTTTTVPRTPRTTTPPKTPVTTVPRTPPTTTPPKTPRTTVPRTPRTTVPRTPPTTAPRTPPTTTPRTPRTTVPPVAAPDCVAPRTADLPAAARDVIFASPLRVLDPTTSPQSRLPGGGRYLQVAPGEGWLATNNAPNATAFVITDSAGCDWRATRAQVSWRELLPWESADRALMDQPGRAPHLVRQWDALSPTNQAIVRGWHRSAVKSSATSCDIAALPHPASAVPASTGPSSTGPANTASACAWHLLRPAAFQWSVSFTYQAHRDDSPVPDVAQQQVLLASGVEWIRRLSDHASDTIGYNGV